MHDTSKDITQNLGDVEIMGIIEIIGIRRLLEKVTKNQMNPKTYRNRVGSYKSWKSWRPYKSQTITEIVGILRHENLTANHAIMGLHRNH